MPAPRPERRNNPLRLLRQILGENGEPMHQEAFAARVGMSVATVRSIEAGRRPLTEDNCLDHIMLNLKAAWNEREGKWKVLGTKWNYEKRHAEQLSSELDPEDPFVDDHTLHRLVERLFDLFGAANREQRQALILYLSKHLAKTAESFGLKVDLKPTEPQWFHTMGPPITIWGKQLPKHSVFVARYKGDGGWRGISPHQEPDGIFDFRSRRTFRADDYPAKDEEEAKAMQEAMKKVMRQQKRDA